MRSTPPPGFALLRQWRTGRGLSQKNVADRLGVSQPYLSLIENQKTTPDFPTIVAIAQLTRISPMAWFPQRLLATCREDAAAVQAQSA